MMDLSCFKAYDIRGRVPDQLNMDVVEKIGRAYARVINPRKVVVGYDIRESSPMLVEALSHGLRSEGVDVYNLGLGGTEHVYFATSHYGMDGGIMVTASHNPKDYNGLKMVMAESKPVNSDTGLNAIRDLVEQDDFVPVKGELPGALHALDCMDSYVEHLLTYIDVSALRPMKVVANAGNGGAGLVIDALEKHLPIEFIKVHHDPDGSFPNGVPNPLLIENRDSTRQAVLDHEADFGVAWDGDFDRCFLFDENGEFIEGYYIVGLLAQQFLKRQTGGKIIHDPRLTWNTQAIVEDAGGQAIESKTGHAFIKQIMREQDAIYGGEMSAHHYFRDFAYCDSGMIPWLLVAELISVSGRTLGQLIEARVAAFPSSGEINRTLKDAATVIQGIERLYESSAREVSRIDGLSMDFADWRFNLRSSNTEPLVRLNVESRGDKALMEARTQDLLSQIDALDRGELQTA